MSVAADSDPHHQPLAGLILLLLLEVTHRFNQLRRRIGGVSERMLSRHLQWLEAGGFVTRTACPVVPPMWNRARRRWPGDQRTGGVS